MKNQPKLTEKNLIRARKVMFDVIEFMDDEGIEYCLEGGTLLGIVRDGDLLPWDHDIDLSILYKDANKFAERIPSLINKGYRVTKGKVDKETKGLKKGEYRVFKVKRLIPSIFKIIFPIFKRYMVVADVFVKFKEDDNIYWQAMEKTMRVNEIYYSSNETVEYMGKKLSVPYKYKEYLTEKYGDWSIPQKDWSCGTDEKTIIEDI